MPLSLASDRLVARFIAYFDDLDRRHRRLESALAMHDRATKQRRARWETAAFRFKVALVCWAAWQRKAGFDPNQPRIPAGSTEGGQWTTASGRSTDDWEISAAGRLGSRPHGHHYFPHSYYGKLPLREDTRKVFDEAKTGRLYAQRHINSKDHDIYSEAVIEKYNEFKKIHNVTDAELTPDLARRFIHEFLTSSDRRIGDFNLRIWRGEIRFLLRFGPRRSE